MHTPSHQVIAAILALVVAALLLILTKTLHISASPEIGDVASYVAISLVFFSIIVTPSVYILRHVHFYFRPRPGAHALPPAFTLDLGLALAFDRTRFEETAVPPHEAAASPARNTGHLSLGDARFVLTPEYAGRIKNFVARPCLRNLTPASSPTDVEKEVLVITGEPGAGKSVIIQELHATLSLGLESGHHSCIPVVIFGRDLTLPSLEQVANRGRYAMRDFVMGQYVARASQAPNGDDLRPIQRLVLERWDHSDFIIFVDGLDEIAQRSGYEIIQQRLRNLVLQDITAGRTAVHRYVLSCRIDEDLELFVDAEKILLRGLVSPKERDRFCRALLRRQRALGRTAERLLNSPRLTPTHVFRRNPYFLSLLINHLREDSRIGDEKIDFGYLMKKYLEREAYRPYTSFDNKYVDLRELRRVLFLELESISRISLEYLGYKSASSGSLGALYDNTILSPSTLNDFISDTKPASKRASPSIGSVIARIASGQQRDRQPSAALRESSGARLPEYDLLLLEKLAETISFPAKVTPELIFEVFGTLPARGLLEGEDWYRALADVLASLCQSLNVDKHSVLAILIFCRSFAAAHVLRILVIDFQKDIVFRFRHRRLAEYYAACYLKQNWSRMRIRSLPPWFGPILNLTCALDSSQCEVLHWIVHHVPTPPTKPLFVWRYALEAAVEAAAFAPPGKEYTANLRDLITVACEALSSDIISGSANR